MRLVMQRVEHNLTESLFEINGLLAMCDLELKITQLPGYRKLCETQPSSSADCCTPWSLPNYVALIANQTSCFDLLEEHVLTAEQLLLLCYPYYRDGILTAECSVRRCRAPVECIRNGAVFNMLHFLGDMGFVEENVSGRGLYLHWFIGITIGNTIRQATYLNLSQAMVFVPIARSIQTLDLFYELQAM